MYLRYAFGTIYELEKKKTKTVLAGPAIVFMTKIYNNYSLFNNDCVWWNDKISDYDFCGRFLLNTNRKINYKIDISNMYEEGSIQL